MRMESPDLIQKNIEKIEQLFPNVITEVKDNRGGVRKSIDFEKLKEVLSGDISEEKEMYEFTWPGKKEALAEAYKSIRKTLRPILADSLNWNKSQNIYIEGDNLDVLKLLQESYLGKIKMIYIDPPYNTGSDFIYPDSFLMNDKKYKSESGYYDDDGNINFSRENAYSSARYHSDWCSMIYPRLLVARNLMTEDGVIFISIDDRELENLKKICGEIFGETNFIGNIVWKHTQQSKNDERYFSRQYNHILVYARDKDKLKPFSFERTEEDNVNYKNPDNDPRGRWRSGDVRSPSYRKTLCFDITAPDGTTIHPPKNGWRWSKKLIQEKIESGEIKFKPDYSGIIRKIYLCDQPGRTPENLWEGKKFGSTRQAAALIKSMFDGVQVFDTPKPPELVMAMLQLLQDKEALVLDFFAGSSTTAQAVLEQNLFDFGSRRFILVQLPEPCPRSSAAYKNGFRTISDIGKERIRRTISRLYDSHPLDENLDFGFRAFRLDSSNLKDIYYGTESYNQRLLSFTESNIKDDRSDLDLLFGCLVDWGLELSKEYKSEIIHGVTIHTYGVDALVACFAEGISEDTIRIIASRHPLRAVFRDSCFNNDAIRVNLSEIFKLISPETEIRVI